MTTAHPRRAASAAVKLVITGPFAAGKTTFIRTISEITVVSTEQHVTDHTRETKPQTTVAMDFGRITVDGDLVLYLYGTPGQDRFEFMWEVLGQGMLGYVLMLDGTQLADLADAEQIAGSFRKMATTPFVVALNRVSGVSPDEESRLRAALDIDPEVPVLTCDATDRDSVKSVLLALLYAVMDQLDTAGSAA